MTADQAGRPKYRKYEKFVLTAAFVLMLLFSCLFQAGIALERTLLNPHFYFRILDDLEIHARLRGILLSGALKAEDDLLVPGSMIEHALGEAISEQWLREQGDMIAGEIISFLKEGPDQLSITVELASRKAVFQQALVGSLSRTQLEKLGLTDSFAAEFLESLELPDRLTLLEIASVDELAAGDARALRLIGQGRTYLLVLPAIAIFLLAGLCFLWAGAAGGFKWAGGAVLGGGLAYYVLLQAAGKLLTVTPPESLAGYGALGSFLAENTEFFPALVLRLLADQVAVALTYAGAGVVLIAAGLAAGRVLKSRGNQCKLPLQ
jgi:hypothetical protein